MNTYTADDIRRALGEAGISKGDTVNIHSSFLALGVFESSNRLNPAVQTISIILNYLGETGTLVAPAFNFGFCDGETFDRKETSSKEMGVMSEALRTWENAERSSHPMQSVTAVGRLAEHICMPDTESAFGIGSSFHRMLELDSKLLLYGVPFRAASFVHYVEERHAVPYRYWKTFQGKYIDNGVTNSRKYKMFVRDLELNPRIQVESLQDEMAGRGELRSAKLGMGNIYSCRFKDFFKTADEKLGYDSFYLIENREEVLKKLNNRKRTKD